jgi:hypothetical protein
VTFTKDAVAKMGKVAEMEIKFQVDDHEFSKLKDRLAKIFDSTVCLTE